MADHRSVCAALFVCGVLGPVAAHAFVDVNGAYSNYSNGRTRVGAGATNSHWSATVSGSNGRISSTGQIAAPGGRTATATIGKTVSGSVLRKFLWRALPLVGTATLLYELWAEYGVSPAGYDPGVAPDTETVPGWGCGPANGNVGGCPGGFPGGGVIAESAEAFCSNPLWLSTGNATGTYRSTQGSASGVGATRLCYWGFGDGIAVGVATQGNQTVEVGGGCVGGGVPRADGLCPTGTYQSITEDQAAALIAGYPIADLMPMVDEALDVLPLALPQPIEIADTIDTVEGPTTTTTGPGGTTTTTTEWEGDVPSGEPDVVDWDESSTTTNPDGTTTTDSTDPLDDGPPEQIDFCAQNPTRVGCAEMGDAEDAEVPNQDVNIAITPVSFGATDASCPADEPLVTSWGTYYFPYEGMCQFADGVRPIVIAMAWLAAGFILLGVRSSED